MPPHPLLVLVSCWLVAACRAPVPRAPSTLPPSTLPPSPLAPQGLTGPRKPPDEASEPVASDEEASGPDVPRCPLVQEPDALCDCLDGDPASAATACTYEAYGQGFGHFVDVTGRHWATFERREGLQRLGLLGDPADIDVIEVDGPEVFELAPGLPVLRLRTRLGWDSGNWEDFETLCPRVDPAWVEGEPRCTQVLRERSKQDIEVGTHSPVGPITRTSFDVRREPHGIVDITSNSGVTPREDNDVGRHAVARVDIAPTPGPGRRTCTRPATAETLCGCLDVAPEARTFARCSLTSPGADLAVLRSTSGALHALAVSARGLTWLGGLEGPAGVARHVFSGDVLRAGRRAVVRVTVSEGTGTVSRIERQYFCPVRAQGGGGCLALPVYRADQPDGPDGPLVLSRLTTRLTPDGRIAVEPTETLEHAELRALVGLHELPW